MSKKNESLSLRDKKIGYICNTIESLTKTQKKEIGKLIWYDDSLRENIKEKGLGIEINTKFMSNSFVNKLYEMILDFESIDEFNT